MCGTTRRRKPDYCIQNKQEFIYLANKRTRAGCCCFCFGGLTMSETIFLRSSCFEVSRWLPQLRYSSLRSKQEREEIAETATLIHSINISSDHNVPYALVGIGMWLTKSLSSWVSLPGRRQTINKQMSRGHKWYEVKIKLGKKIGHKGWGTVEVAILYYKGCQGAPLLFFIKKIKAFQNTPPPAFHIGFMSQN